MKKISLLGAVILSGVCLFGCGNENKYDEQINKSVEKYNEITDYYEIRHYSYEVQEDNHILLNVWVYDYLDDKSLEEDLSRLEDMIEEDNEIEVSIKAFDRMVEAFDDFDGFDENNDPLILTVDNQ